MLLRQAINDFLDSRDVKDSTLGWYESCLVRLADRYAGMDVADISANHVRTWRDELLTSPPRNKHGTRSTGNDTLSSRTVYSYMRAASTFFCWLHDEEVMPTDITSDIRMPDKGKHDVTDKAISEENIAKMAHSARVLGVLEHAVILTLRDTGARASGIVGMTKRDLNLDKERGRVYEKGDKMRIVFFTPEGIAALRLYLQSRNDYYDAVFVGQRGPLTYDGLYHVTRRVAEHAGVPKPWSPHAWRHAYARRMLLDDVRIDALADLLGHESVETTRKIYAPWTVNELHAIYRKHTNGHSQVDDVPTGKTRQKMMW